MVFKNFEEMISHVKNSAKTGRIAVAAADEHSIEACIKAESEGLALPIFLGDKKEILAVYQKLGKALPEEKNIYDIPDPKEACEKAVSIINSREADFLMKGKADTRTYLGAVVDKKNGLGTGGLMSHFSILDLPNYHKLIVPVDGGMVPYPTLEQKKQIIENCVKIFLSMGYTCPKVAVLTCIEKVNPKMPETIEARKLQEMNEHGEIKDCIVAGPVSYDCAMSREIAEMKGYKSPVCGDADILLAPNIHAANILGKAFTVTCKARMAGFIVGTKCPVIMTSRGASLEEKYLSIALATAVTQ